jgi:hypothetical protein
MVNNSVNFNKINNHLSSQIIERTNTQKKKPQHMVMEIQVLTWIFDEMEIYILSQLHELKTFKHS